MSAQPSSSGRRGGRGRGGRGRGGSVNGSRDTGDFSDVQFTVGQQFGPAEIFSAHKHVLGLRSAVFATMFDGSAAADRKNYVDIPDVAPVAFANMLRFLYTDTVDLRTDNVDATMMCADKYEVPLLVEKCWELMSAHLAVDNCLFILENCCIETIVQRCLEFIDKFADNVLASDGVAALGKGTLAKILQRDTLSVKEQNVYLAAEKWALNECTVRKLEPSGAHRRQVLEEVLYLVRFPLMSYAQLAEGPGKSGLLLESEMRDLYQYKFSATKPPLAFSTESRPGHANRIDEPIAGPAYPVAAIIFDHQEKVFVKLTMDAETWVPGEIIGMRERMSELGH
ncbi:BTB/POZ domain-containing protein 3-like [Paramacrobiotus metropolitanus]|uniref:BTB/POZ domain-containing protein 3-like n=1 Tax=Paramacrobiotus metropolitanus TaxID=2943436 RepID=UPI002445F1AC|nr:BTB/POZ domain-containing protein 3-like [Paramacrobiotus metropolitanus]